MATFYLDYEGGNDANDGTSFANRWKTITSGATAARIAPGDTIRIMGSPAPTSLGINATWTNKSATVTLASALNALITNCDSAWTASANVTSTADTAIYRTSTGSAKHVIAAGFTTGLASYFALGGAQNYSAYQGITLWVYVAVKTLSAGELSIRLCSDAAGVTTVDTLALPAITQTGQWVPVHIDKGSALGSSIQSIALYGDTDNGAITVYLDNISTTKAAGNDCLTLRSLIGKNTANEYWWAVRAISGTTVTLDHSPSGVMSVTARGYYGTTESVTTYKRETIKTDLVATSTTIVQAIQDSGSAGNLITFSGGWNRTDMSTQTLETWFDGQSGFGMGLQAATKNYISVDKLNFVRYRNGFDIDTSATDWTIGTMYIGNCELGVDLSAVGPLTITALHIYGSYNTGLTHLNGTTWVIGTLRIISCSAASVVNGFNTAGSPGTGHWVITTMDVCNANWNGFALGTGANVPSNISIGTLTCSDNGQVGFTTGSGTTMEGWSIGTLNAHNNGSAGVSLSSLPSQGLRIGTLNATGNATYGFVPPTTGSASVIIDSLTTSGNTSGGVSVAVIGGETVIRKSSIAETTKVAFSSSSFGRHGTITFQNYNGAAGDHRSFVKTGISGTSPIASSGAASIFSESSVRHTASGLAWKISVNTTTYITSDFPVEFKVGKVALAASVTKTITVWVRRTNTGITAKLVVRGGQLDGITTDQVATAAAAQDTWEQLSVNVTPTIAGVIDVEVQVYGGSTYSVYVDDLGVS